MSPGLSRRRVELSYSSRCRAENQTLRFALSIRSMLRRGTAAELRIEMEKGAGCPHADSVTTRYATSILKLEQGSACQVEDD